MKRLEPALVEDIVLRKSPNGLGFSISGGLFTEHIANDHGIFVTKIIKGSIADLDGKLSVGDRILSVNDKLLDYVTHDDAVALIASSVEESDEIVLRVGKVNKYTTITTQQPNEQTRAKMVSTSSINNLSPKLLTNGSNVDMSAAAVPK